VLAVVAIAVIYYMTRENSGDSGTIALSGTVEAVEVDLSFKAAGRIEYIRFDESDQISEGDTISELSHRESLARIRQIDDQISASESQRQALEIQLESIQRNLAKVKSLVGSGGATTGEQEDLEDKVRGTEAAISAAESSENALKSQRDLLEVIFSDEFLTAPSDGSVIVRSAEPGEIITPGKAIMTVADLSKLEIKVYVPESKLAMVKTGQEVSIEVDSYPGRKFDGVISRIAEKAEFTPKNVQTKEERVKTVFAVTVSTGDHDGILKPGMPCDVFIELAR